jgi:hypothetical protein
MLVLCFSISAISGLAPILCVGVIGLWQGVCVASLWVVQTLDLYDHFLGLGWFA